MAPGSYIYALLMRDESVIYSRGSAFNNDPVLAFVAEKNNSLPKDVLVVSQFDCEGKEVQIHGKGSVLVWSQVVPNESSVRLVQIMPSHSMLEMGYNQYTLVLGRLAEQLSGKLIRDQHEHNLSFTFAIMNSLKFGVIATDQQGKILYANDYACRSLNIRRRELLLIPIEDLIPTWSSIFQIVASGGKFMNEEVFLSFSNNRQKFSLNVSGIYEGVEHLVGLVVSVRELDNVYQIVNKYTGMQARFVFDDIVCKSKIMSKLVEYARTVSDSPSTILIEGESGTGKEVFAQSIHNDGRRREAGFVAINCAAIPENLIESELFGYDDGAFTGAKKGGHPGKFELANGGTLFLDEIGDMKPDMQAKLLRVIQEGAVMRIGGVKIIPVDVRIIAATNRNLKKEVEAGRFRLDLYYRLSVIPITIPPLRERISDLPSLIRLFLNKKSIKLQKSIPQLRFSELQQMLDYSWPGNIRQLENFIEQLVNFDGKFSASYFQEETERKQILDGSPDSILPLANIEVVSMDEAEAIHIQKMIAHCKGNLTATARLLKISRNTLYLKLKKYSISNVNKLS